MSIEAHAQKADGWSLSVHWSPNNKDAPYGELVDTAARDIFAEARRRTLEHGEGVDYVLHIGALGTSTATRYLGLFLRNQSVQWSHVELCVADTWFHEHLADFPPPPPPAPDYDDDKRWAYWSAREFLDACVRGGYGIEFSS